MTTTSKNPAVRLPAEWEPQQAVLMALPHAQTDWAYMLDDAQECTCSIVRAIIPFAKVVLLAPDADEAYKLLADCPSDRLTVVEWRTNDTWTRDYGPITTIDANGRAILNDYIFNGWGLKFASDRDNMATRFMHRAGALTARYRNCLDFVLEGGSIESDGRGTILTSEQCLLTPNRNARLNRHEISRRLKDDLGALKILWIKSGLLEGDDTDGHIDTLARLAPENTIIFTGCDNPADPHYQPLLSMRNELGAMRNAQGEPFHLVQLPLPDAIYDEDGLRLPATYANFLIINGAVIMPTYGQPKKDRLAEMILQSVFTDRRIVTVDCRALIRQHGSLHCATMQLPHFDL